MATAVRRAPRLTLGSGAGGVMTAERPRRYSGKLATPIICPSPPTFSGAVTDERVKKFRNDYDAHRRKVQQNVARQLAKKMALLMKQYEIADKRDLKELAWALAFEHVPGFKIVPDTGIMRGRRKEWHGRKLKALYDDVQSVKRQHNYNDRQALKFMSQNPQFAKTWGPPSSRKGFHKEWVETLESRLHDAKRYVSFLESLPTLIEDARAAVLRRKFRKL
jgi:hypothetical protein